MDSGEKFHTILRKRLEKKVSPQSDAQFWQKFHQENGAQRLKIKSRPFWLTPLIRYLIPTATVALLAIWIHTSLNDPSKSDPAAERINAHLILEESEMYANLDLLLELEDIEDLSEEEWEYLIHGENG